MKTYILIIILGLLMFGCSNQVKEISKDRLDALVDHEIFNRNDLIKIDYSIISLYQEQVKKCNDLSLDYTGNQYLRFDLLEENVSFSVNDKKKEFINLELKGYLCPNSSKDILYNPFNVFVSDTNNVIIENDTICIDSISNFVKGFIINSTNDYSNYPYIIQIVSSDSLKISQLSKVVNSVIQGYLQFYNIIIKTNEYSTIANTYPFRLKIIPKSIFIGKVPLPPN